MRIETPAEYLALRAKIDSYDKARVALYGEKKCSFTPSEIEAIGQPSPSNEERSAVEVWDFQHQAHERYFAYVNEQERLITTWTGDVLGRITEYGREYTDNFGGRRRNMQVVGINRVVYHATYFTSSGSYCRLKARRHKGSIVVKP